jgi:hypothetical protein
MKPQIPVPGPDRQSPEVSGEGEGDDLAPLWDRTSTFVRFSTPGPNSLLRQANGQGFTCQQVDRHAVARMRESEA